MTGERGRPPWAESSVDIPLTGDAPRSHDLVGDSPAGPTPDGPRIGRLAALLGVGLAISAAVGAIGFAWIGGTADEAGRDPSSTIDRAVSAPLITTPPTLVPLDTISATTDTSAVPVTVPDPDDLAARGGVGSLLDQVSVPTYPPAGTDLTVSNGEFDLQAAVSALGSDVPRRSSTHLELGVRGFAQDYGILRDPTTDRYILTFGEAVSITDETIRVVYWDFSTPGDEQWVLNDYQLVAEHFGVERVGVVYDRLLRGPVRPDTIGSATVVPGDFVVLDDGVSIAKAFTVDLPGDLVPEWQLYVLGPTQEFVPSDRPDRLTYTVYVDRGSEIRRIVGLSDLGGIPQLIVHDIESPADPFMIDLPDPAVISTGPPRIPAGG